jgi:arylsulfatase A-like enzyme
MLAKFRISGWILLGLVGLAACRGRGRPPNVVIVLVDTLRADRLGSAGNRDGLTPFLDELASRGTVFRNAYAASSWTIPSVASLFTSRYPSQHRAIAHNYVLMESEITLAEQLQAAGYLTVAAAANVGISKERGFAQGFSRWSEQGFARTATADKLRGETLRRRALGLMQKACMPSTETPCLLYIHYMEPHAPYDPPAARYPALPVPIDAAGVRAANTKLKLKDGTTLTAADVDVLRALYDQEVAELDDQVRGLFEALAAQHFLDDAIVVITADHGEEFKEHGGVSHGTALYGETVRVPLIIQAPGNVGGRVVEEAVSLIDVAPTLLQLVGLPAVPTFEGRSLVPLLSRPSSWWERPFRVAQAIWGGHATDVIFELPPDAAHADRRRHAAGIVRGPIKLLVRPDGKADVYDLTADPRETAANAAAVEAQRTDLETALDAALASHRSRATGASEQVPLDETTKERLRALGYDDF